jgi:excisionase family DNA binding protein
MNRDNQTTNDDAPEEKRVFSRKEAARYLGVGLATIDRAIARRDISVTRLAGRVLFQKEHLEEYLNRNVTVAKPQRMPRGLLGLER